MGIMIQIADIAATKVQLVKFTDCHIAALTDQLS